MVCLLRLLFSVQNLWFRGSCKVSVLTAVGTCIRRITRSVDEGVAMVRLFLHLLNVTVFMKAVRKRLLYASSASK